MNALDRIFEIYPSSFVSSCLGDPKKHQYCCFSPKSFVNGEGDVNFDVLESQTRILDAMRERPDVNSLRLHLGNLLYSDQFCKKIEELLTLSDRSWSITLLWPSTYLSIDPSKLKSALSVLRNVKRLQIGRSSELGYRSSQESLTVKHKILSQLPAFTQLKDLRIGSCHIQHLEILFQASLAPKLADIELVPHSQGYAGPIFSRETSGLIHSIVMRKETFRTPAIADTFIDALVKLPCLKMLKVDFCCLGQNGTETLCQWLQSPHCSVVDLDFGPLEQPHQLPTILSILPNIPKLEAITLQLRQCAAFDWDSLFEVLLKTPHVESVTVRIRFLGLEVFDKIFEFQRHHRPRVFHVNYGSPRNGPPIEKIHFTSMTYRTLRRFQLSNGLHPPVPLSAWANVLEKLGVAFDCPSSDVHAVGVEARFTLLQELLGNPLRFVNQDELYKKGLTASCSSTSVDQTKRRRLR